jgi:hypothetical protein
LFKKNIEEKRSKCNNANLELFAPLGSLQDTVYEGRCDLVLGFSAVLSGGDA